jgi:hypothetical protein
MNELINEVAELNEPEDTNVCKLWLTFTTMEL